MTPTRRRSHRHALLRARLVGRACRFALAVGLAGSLQPACASASTGYAWIADPVTGAQRLLETDGVILTACPDGHGGLFVGGSFDRIGGARRQNVAQLLANGSVGPWAPPVDGAVTAVALIDTSVYLGGTFAHVGASVRTRIAAVGSVTGALTPWSPSASAQVAAFAKVGNRIFVGGAFIFINDVRHSGFAALDATTGALLPYDTDVNQVYAIAVRDTELFVAGEHGVHALSPTTGLHTRLFPSMNAWAYTLSIVGDELFVGGGFRFLREFFTGNLYERSGAMCLDLHADTLTRWAPEGPSTVRSLAVVGDAVYLGGAMTFVSGGNRFGFAKVSRATGGVSAWAASDVFGNSFGENFLAVPFSAGILLTAPMRVADMPLSAMSTVDARFPEVDGPVFTSLVLGDTLFFGGYFNQVTDRRGAPPFSAPRSNLAAIRISTGELLDWRPSVNGQVRALLPYRGALLVGGAFDLARRDGPFEPHAGVMVVDRTAGEIEPWNPELDVAPFGCCGGGAVRALELWNDTLYVGGFFTRSSGLSRPGGCAFDMRTGALTEWNPSAQGGGGALTGIVRDGPDVYVAGDYVLLGGTRTSGLTRVDAQTGAIDLSWPSVGGRAEMLTRRGRVLYAAGAAPVAVSLDDGTLLPWHPDVSDAHLVVPYEAGLLVAGSTGYDTNTPSPSLAYVDPQTGASLAPLSIFASDRIWTVSASNGLWFLGGAFHALSNRTAHAYLAAVPAPSSPTPLAPELLRAFFHDHQVRLLAYSPEGAPPALQRRLLPDGEWQTRPGEPVAEGRNWRYEDADVAPGSEYAYRICASPSGRVVCSREVVARIPGGSKFSILSLEPQPNTGAFVVRWTMPTAGRASMEVHDVSGRKIMSSEGSFEAGEAYSPVRMPAQSPGGIYFVTLTTTHGVRTRRTALVR